MRVEFTIADDIHGRTSGKRYSPRHDCEECQGEIYERVVEAGLSVIRDVRHGIWFLFGEAFREVYAPPADAKEWTCHKCGGDVLYCECNR